jgi:hypothetical protein
MQTQVAVGLLAFGLILIFIILKILFFKKQKRVDSVFDLIYRRFLKIYTESSDAERGHNLTEYLEKLRSGREEMLNVPTCNQQNVATYAEGAWSHFYFLNA